MNMRNHLEFSIYSFAGAGGAFRIAIAVHYRRTYTVHVDLSRRRQNRRPVDASAGCCAIIWTHERGRGKWHDYPHDADNKKYYVNALTDRFSSYHEREIQMCRGVPSALSTNLVRVTIICASSCHNSYMVYSTCRLRFVA